MGLYNDYFYNTKINQLFSERETLAAMLRFEAALALAQAECGIVPKEAAQAIAK
jgi:3-carboxy-cis,cis-muconate cycloisomerase